MTIENFGFDTDWLIVPGVLMGIALFVGLWFSITEEEPSVFWFVLLMGAIPSLVFLVIAWGASESSYTESVNDQFEAEFGVYLTSDSEDIPNHAQPAPQTIQFVDPDSRTYDYCTAILDENTSYVTILCGGTELESVNN